MAITLYYVPYSSATRPQVALEELGLPYTAHRVDMANGENKTPEYLALQPLGKVPALVDGDVKIFESLAIILYLGERYGVERGLWPALGTPAHADALAWCVWAQVELTPCVINYVHHVNGEYRFGLPASARNTEFAEISKQAWEARMAALEKRMAGREFLIGDTYTLADLAVASAANVGAMMGKLPVEAYPSVAAWVARGRERPAIAKVLASYGPR